MANEKLNFFNKIPDDVLVQILAFTKENGRYPQITSVNRQFQRVGKKIYEEDVKSFKGRLLYLLNYCNGIYPKEFINACKDSIDALIAEKKLLFFFLTHAFNEKNTPTMKAAHKVKWFFGSSKAVKEHKEWVNFYNRIIVEIISDMNPQEYFWCINSLGGIPSTLKLAIYSVEPIEYKIWGNWEKTMLLLIQQFDASNAKQILKKHECLIKNKYSQDIGSHVGILSDLQNHRLLTSATIQDRICNLLYKLACSYSAQIDFTLVSTFLDNVIQAVHMPVFNPFQPTFLNGTTESERDVFFVEIINILGNMMLSLSPDEQKKIKEKVESSIQFNDFKNYFSEVFSKITIEDCDQIFGYSRK